MSEDPAPYNNEPPSMLRMDGYDDCLVGTVSRHGYPDILCYDLNQIIHKLMTDDGMDRETAVDFFEFNMLGSALGETMPCYLDPGAVDGVLAVEATGFAGPIQERVINGQLCWANTKVTDDDCFIRYTPQELTERLLKLQSRTIDKVLQAMESLAQPSAGGELDDVVCVSDLTAVVRGLECGATVTAPGSMSKDTRSNAEIIQSAMQTKDELDGNYDGGEDE